jgi:ABC-type sugar transport system ATPase subunit
LLDHHTLSELIVGEGLASSAPILADSPPLREELLQVDGLTRWGLFEDVRFSLRRGEILGIAGLRGSGRTEILKALSGIEPADAGRISLGGVDVVFRSPSEALRAGVAYLPEDRESEGLVKVFSIRDNLLLNSVAKFSHGGFISWEDARRRAGEIFFDVRIHAFSMEQNVDELSGGNKQKVVIGRIMTNEPEIYLLDEPTRGVDVGAKRSILSIVNGPLRVRAGVILTSPGLDDLMEVCDRILVLYKGRLLREYSREAFDEKSIFMDIQGFGFQERRGGGECRAV